MPGFHQFKSSVRKMREFPIGSPFSCNFKVTPEDDVDDLSVDFGKEGKNEHVSYGWITGLTENSSGEVIFLVRFSNEKEPQEIPLHPKFVRRVDHDYGNLVAEAELRPI